ncbi:hypothetical protein [Spirosoma oryzicola]|uniref:hypothetical protein n=1 Tax=Spirosoma oryzicola TaxID=2898794 RepID=UPI001E629E41|nr:hypothetical protein [Spirosoma oryzicola]UHG93444.1 hypothetical protein LQ777_11180 [Spirosoma oryzicola]
MLERITSWLTSSGDYEAGLILLRETGYTGFALSVLDMGEDAYTRNRLETELTAWCNKQNSMLQPGPDLSPLAAKQSSAPLAVSMDYGSGSNSVVVVTTNPLRVETPPTDEPEAVQSIRRQIFQLMDLRTDAKAWIRANEHLGNSEAAQIQRRPYAYQVKRLTLQLDELYSQLDFFTQYGYLPQPIEQDVDQRSLLLNTRSYVSRYKGYLKKKNLTPEQRQSYQVQYDLYLARKQQLELKSNHDSPPPGAG